MKKGDYTKSKITGSLFLIWLVIYNIRQLEIPKTLYLSTIALLVIFLILWNINKK